MNWLRYSIFTFLLLIVSHISYATGKYLDIYLDADFSNHAESAQSIKQGITTALSEINNTIQGYKLKLILLDHHGNVKRSKRNYMKYIKDPHGLVLFGGLHSPPLIKNRSFINENKALTLVPWAAGAPITRYPSKINWIFRLSIDDSKAGLFLINYALTKKQCKSVHLLLEDTSWGDSNLRNMLSALQQHKKQAQGITRFGWNLKENGAKVALLKIVNSGADCIILVSNAIEGAHITKAMASLPAKQRIPIISHWGLTGGNFHKEVNNSIRHKVYLRFIQSCFSFLNKPLSPLAKTVFNEAKSLYPNEIKHAGDIRSPVGFIHAYDLTKILIAALNKITLTNNSEVNRNNLRLALENIHKPVNGLIKVYTHPFAVFDKDKAYDAHEALTPNDYCIAKYNDNDEIIVIQDGK